METNKDKIVWGISHYFLASDIADNLQEMIDQIDGIDNQMMFADVRSSLVDAQQKIDRFVKMCNAEIKGSKNQF